MRPSGDDGYLLVVAGRQDLAAASLVSRWSQRGALLLTPAALSEGGWRCRLRDPARGRGRVAGRALPFARIRGVLTRLPFVDEGELDQIVRVDRRYVAAEMTAFLRFWLAALPCPVVNRPTPSCLCGPSLRPEQWTTLAARLGIPVRTVRRRAAFPVAVADPRPQGREADHASVVVVGGRPVGSVHRTLGKQARALAGAADADLLEVRFDGAGPGARFMDATVRPESLPEGVADALLEHLERGWRRPRPAGSLS